MSEVKVRQAIARAGNSVIRGRPASSDGRALPAGRHPLRALSFRNISAIYIFVAMFIIFSLWVPSTFLNLGTWRSMLDTESLNALVAIGVVLPLAAGCFNLAVGAEVGMGAIMVAWLLAIRGVPMVPAIAVTVAASALIGLTSGLLIVRAHIDSFIATLGMSAVLLALIEWVSGSVQILNLGTTFQNLSTDNVLGITYPVWFMLAVAIVAWYVLERTPTGRRIYATGGNIEAARLAGVRISAVIVGCCIACAVIAGSAGMLESSLLGTGDPTIGPGFLLPAYAAAFLGSTQIRSGRYNVWGTVIAVYVLATGVKGLQLAGAPVWIPDLFNGVVLLLAVGMARHRGAAARMAAIRRMRVRGLNQPPADERDLSER